MAITWAEDSITSRNPDTVTVAQATCTTGTESAPATADAASGLSLRGVGTVHVHAESAAAEFTAGGTLDVYLQNPKTLRWNKRTDLVMTIEALTGQAFEIGAVEIRGGCRIAVVPTGLGQACVITLLGALVR